MENENGSKLGIAILYALIAAIVGGLIWGGIVIITNYELGIIAWGIGGLAGYSVIFAAKDRITQAHRLVAVIASLIGIIIGKYMGFAYFFNDGFELFLDPFTRASFGQYFSDLFGLMDLVFIVLAVVTAWQIPTKHVQGGADNVDTVLDADTIESEGMNEAAANNEPYQTGTHSENDQK